MNSSMTDLSSLISEPTCRSLVDSFRREGSLPFKKRKLYHDLTLRRSSSDWLSPTEKQPSCSFTSTPTTPGGSDEKIAALALVAAATSSTLPAAPVLPNLFASSPSPAPPPPPPITAGEQARRMHLIHNNESSEDASSTAADQLSGDSHLISPVSKTKATSRRIHHPPLTAPLPGGCHGRTSRNNSYCRRQPCYNGSKYCKLHYQQYVVSGIRADASTTSSDSDSGGGRTTPPQLMPAVHQDKRYAGLEGEVRCCATTTRGRACAYIRVNGTNYCYLHADYDTNPPPRRALGNTSSDTKAVTLVCSDSPVRTKGSGNSPRSTSMLLKTPTKSPPSVTSEESSLSSSAWVTPTARTSDARQSPKAARKKSEYPLLSSIPSDQWFDKRVKIMTGPLANRKGRVVKWGNGWVSVRVSNDRDDDDDEDGLVHNRRSIELHMLPEDGSCTEAPACAPAPPVEAGGPLTRCVSQEVEAPTSEVEMPMLTNTKESSATNESQVTLPAAGPELDTKQSSDEQLKQSPTEESVKNVAPSTIESSGCREDDDARVKAEPSTSESSGYQDDDAVAKPKAEDDCREGDTAAKPEATDGNQSEVKPCPSESPEQEGLPLVEMLAQEGIRKQQLNLLFGTAALERGRRTISKPARYEDTAMLEKPRSRQTPVSSPRSPRRTLSKG